MSSCANPPRNKISGGASRRGASDSTCALISVPLFSKKIWSTLSPEDQALIAKSAKEAQLDERKLWYAMEEKSIKQMQEAGVEIIKIDDKKPFQAAVQPVWEKYGKQHADLIKRIQDTK